MADSSDPLKSSFRSAANAVAQLYTISQQNSRRSYEAGYYQCLMDLAQILSSECGGEVAPSIVTNFVTSKIRDYSEASKAMEQNPSQPLDIGFLSQGQHQQQQQQMMTSMMMMMATKDNSAAGESAISSLRSSQSKLMRWKHKHNIMYITLYSNQRAAQ